MMQISMRRRALLCSAALAPVLLSACGKSGPKFNGTDIGGMKVGENWTLTDFNGETRTIRDFAGKAVVVFFGYTQCPDVCPTALAEMADVMQKLGPQADQVQVVLISVDPERDTAEILKQYVTGFDPRFLALRGTAEQTRKAAVDFKAYYAKVSKPDGSYSMDHTASFYLFDKTGHARALCNESMGADALAHDLKTVLTL